MRIDKAIENFVNGFTEGQLKTIYCFYKPDSYGHLLKNPINPLTIDEQREGLVKYLESFIIYADPGDEERPEALRDILKNKDYARFINILHDQHYQEPLYRVVNINSEF